jgi:predicted O-methyltransferase YrrM
MTVRQAVGVWTVALRNVVLGGNIVSLGLLSNPRKMLEYINDCLFLYKAVRGRGVPQRNVYEVLPSEDTQTIELANLSRGGAWFLPQASHTVDIVSLCLICRLIRPKVVFEIGTMAGYTAFHFALNTPDDAQIFTLDLPGGLVIQPKLSVTALDKVHIDSHASVAEPCFEDTHAARKITCLFGDSATFDYSRFRGKVDFFFIDGAHSYDYVRCDTLNAIGACHPGSVIAWHDFGRVGVNGVSRWILELSKQHEIYSVPGGSVAFMVVK